MKKISVSICRWLVSFSLALGLAACTLPVYGGLSEVEATLDTVARAWFDAPLEGMVLPAAPYVVVFHGASNAGVERSELKINDTQVATQLDPEVGLLLAVFQTTWTPPGPGQYVLHARIQGQDGRWSEPSQVTIRVEAPPTHTLPPTSSPTPTRPPTVTATDSATPTGTSTATVASAPLVFTPRVSPDLFYSGGCTPDQVNISVQVSPAEKIANVYLFFHLENQAGSEATAWAEPVMMSNLGRGQFSAILTSRVIPGASGFDSAWLLVQFAAIDSQGIVQGRSEVFAGTFLARCGLRLVPRVTLRPGLIPVPRVGTMTPTPIVIK